MRPIDADALKEELCKEYSHFNQRIKIGTVFRLLRDAPSIDAVPVVRCKDCKWRDNDLNPQYLPCTEWYPRDDFFCASGKKER